MDDDVSFGISELEEWLDIIERDDDGKLDRVYQKILTLINETPSSSRSSSSSSSSSSDDNNDNDISNDDKLKLYGLYKHIKDGPCCDGSSRPSIFYPVARAKYYAWESYQDYTINQAKKEYIHHIITCHNQQGQKPSNISFGKQCLQIVQEAYATIGGGGVISDGTEEEKKTTTAATTAMTKTTTTTTLTPPSDQTEEPPQIRPPRSDGSSTTSTSSSGSSSSSTTTFWTSLSSYFIYILQEWFGIQPLVPRGNVDIDYSDIFYGIYHCCYVIFMVYIFQQKSTIISEYDHYMFKITQLWKQSCFEQQQQQQEREIGKETICSKEAAAGATAVAETKLADSGQEPGDDVGVVVGLSVKSLLDLYLSVRRYGTTSRKTTTQTSTTMNKQQSKTEEGEEGDAADDRTHQNCHTNKKQQPQQQNPEVIFFPPISVPGMMHVLKYHNLDIVPVDIRDDSGDNNDNDDDDNNEDESSESSSSSSTSSSILRLDVNDIESAITPNTVAIMIVHVFGTICTTSQDMSELRLLANKHQLDIIEDCAECYTGLGIGLGGGKHGGGDNGSGVMNYQGSVLSDIRFFSFGMIKTCTALGGGVAITRNEEIATSMDRLQEITTYSTATSNKKKQQGQQSEFEYLKKLILCIIVKVIGSSPMFYGLYATICSNVFGLDLNSIVSWTLSGFSTKGDNNTTTEKDKKGSKHSRIQEQQQIQQLDLISKIRKRPSPTLLAVVHRRLYNSRQIAPSLLSRIKRCQRMISILQETTPKNISLPATASLTSTNAATTTKANSNTFWLFPIACKNRIAINEVMRRKHGFDVAHGASQLCSVSKFAQVRRDGAAQRHLCCPRADKLMEDILYLPVASYPMSDTMMKKLARALNHETAKTSTKSATKSIQPVTHYDKSCPVCWNEKSKKLRKRRLNIFGFALLAAFITVRSCLTQTTFIYSFVRTVIDMVWFGLVAFFVAAVATHFLRWAMSSYYLESSTAFAKYSDMIYKPSVEKMPATPSSSTCNLDVLSKLDCLKLNGRSRSTSAQNNKVILTGSTGFVGSLLLRDLLFHRKRLGISGGVILICRKKNGESAKERIETLLSKPMFAFLSSVDREQLVDVVEGDVVLRDLGLSSSDSRRIFQDEAISHVFHCAASVSFAQDLPEAAAANITSSINLQSMAGKLKNNKAQFVHISTAFVHGDMSGTVDSPLKEELFSLGPYEPSKILRSMLGTQFYASKAMRELGFPNTYTFSKCVCEHLLMEVSPANTLIIRPSIVGPAISSPFEGWAGDRPSTMTAGACLFMSFPWNVWCLGDHTVAYIPVDVLSNYILAKAFAGTSDDNTSVDSSTDSSFERVSQVSDTSADLVDVGEEVQSLKSGTQFGRIYNAAWDSESPGRALFTWADYASTVAHLGPVLGYFGMATAYIGLFFASIFVPRMHMSLEMYQQLHYYLVMLPLKVVQMTMHYVGRSSRTLSTVISFVDLPVLFFPFTSKSFYFQSEIRAPDTMNGERYVFSSIVASHRFVLAATNRKRRNSVSPAQSLPPQESEFDMSKLVVGGSLHSSGWSDLWWALCQPRGSYFVRLAGFLFIKILRSVSSAVTVDVTALGSIVTSLKQRDNDGIYLILAPTHKSFFDFILLSYIFFALPELQIDIPFIAAADDFERLPLIGWVAPYLKAIYIERGRGVADTSLTESLGSLKKNQFVRAGSCLEVFLEGTRSRDRRFVTPKTGFLRSLSKSGGQHIIVPVTINYEGIPEQSVLAGDVGHSCHANLNIEGMLRWLKGAATGKVNLGRIHVSANSAVSMTCESPGDFNSLTNEIQKRQQQIVCVSDYHIRAASKLLGIDPLSTREEVLRLGCNLWPGPAGCLDCMDRLALPDDPSELCTIMLQFSHLLAPCFLEIRPQWSTWLSSIRHESVVTKKEAGAGSLEITQSLLTLFDAADEAATEALKLLHSTGFHEPSRSHALQTANKLECNVPLQLLSAAIEMRVKPAKTENSLQDSFPASQELTNCISNMSMVGEDEVLGFWGFKDSGFVIRVDKKGRPFVMMKGNRYSLCGMPLKKLIPFIEAEMQVKIDPLREAPTLPLTSRQDFSCRLGSSHIDVLRCHFSKISLNAADRARHGTGHSQEDVYSLRCGSCARVPDVVVWPSSEAEVETLVDLAKEMEWCLIPFGGGTNVSNATQCPSYEVEPRPIISVDMTQMRRILWLNQEDGLAHVEAGITGRELVGEMERRGFTIGHEPDSIEFSTLGGWIATNASGMKRSRYGNIEDIVKSVRVVGSSGILWKGNENEESTAGRVSEGLDLCSLMMGSEGCLGIVTSAVIRVWPIPESKEYDSVLFSGFKQGLRFVRAVAQLGHCIPASVRLLDNEHFRLGQALRPESSIFRRIGEVTMKASLLLKGKFDPNSVVCATICYEGSLEEVRMQKCAISRLSCQFGGVSLGADVGKAGYDLTFTIAYLRDFAMSYSLLGESFETFVPWSKIESVVSATKRRILEEHSARHLPGVPFVGCRVTQLYHEGVCLYFYMCLSCEGVANASSTYAVIEHIARREILERGGSLSHHHGVGKIRAPFLKDRLSPSLQSANTSIKNALDKDNVFGARNGAHS